MIRRGPIEDGEWATTLDAHVVDAGPPVRVHGYESIGDLARHYRFAEIVGLALRGTLPSAEEGAALDLALKLLAPTTIAEAPAHTAALMLMMGVPPANTVGTAAMSLAQQAQALVDEHAAWLAWLAAPSAEPPAAFAAKTDDDRRCVAVVRATICGEITPWLVRIEPTLEATALGLLFACGLRSPHAIVTAMVVARLPLVVAEAERHAGGLRRYPIGLPPFDYEEGEA